MTNRGDNYPHHVIIIICCNSENEKRKPKLLIDDKVHIMTTLIDPHVFNWAEELPMLIRYLDRFATRDWIIF